MKRFLALLFLCILLFVSGCNNGTALDLPVKYYYPNATIAYGTEDGFISYEFREAKNKSTLESINDYLKGPTNSGHENPFPENTTAKQFELQNDIVYLILSDSYATLTGLDISIANACLSMTVLELTGASAVSIQCDTMQLDGQDSIIMDRNATMLYDSNKNTTPTETPPLETAK